jgi:hypothetical protein
MFPFSYGDVINRYHFEDSSSGVTTRGWRECTVQADSGVIRCFNGLGFDDLFAIKRVPKQAGGTSERWIACLGAEDWKRSQNLLRVEFFAEFKVSCWFSTTGMRFLKDCKLFWTN